MSLIIPANTLASGGFNVDNSVRLDGTSAYLYKVNPSTSSTNNKRGTVSCWVKKWGFPNNSIYLINANDNGQERFIIQISNGDQIIGSYRNASGTNDVDISTSLDRVYRDPAAWFHIVVAWNTSDGTGGNRLKLYVNGEEQALTFSQDIAQDTIIPLNVPNYNSSFPITIGRNYQGGAAQNYLPAYLAEFCFVDGQTLDGTSFGEFDEDSGIWKPIDVSGLTFGGLGWHLQFENSSALGTDSNSNGTWTTAGLAAIDQTTDTPTNNFATLNPLDKSGGGVTVFSEGNLITTAPSGGAVVTAERSTVGVSSGKWYVELKCITEGGDIRIGIIDMAQSDFPTKANPYFFTQMYTYQASNGNKQNDSTSASYGATYTAGDIVSIALDADSGSLTFYKNGASQGVAYGSLSTSITWGFVSTLHNLSSMSFNFGNPTFTGTDKTDGNSRGSFEYAPPSGYLSLCTANLSEVLG